MLLNVVYNLVNSCECHAYAGISATVVDSDSACISVAECCAGECNVLNVALDKKLFLNFKKARRYIFREVMDIVLNSYGEEGYSVYASKLTAEEKEIMGI